ncbi:MAG: hypothetical protein J5829_04410 [Lachnospiraceae bacterium]|nr:hypothetical protein [Lachnospiraceae bacterium]
MSLEKARKVLKRFGFIWVIFGGLIAVLGIVLLIGSRAAAADASRAANAPVFLQAGIKHLVLGIVGIDAGIYCFKALKDPAKLKTVRNIAAILIGLAVLALVSGYVQGTLAANQTSSYIASAAVNALLLYVVGVVRKGSESDNS